MRRITGLSCATVRDALRDQLAETASDSDSVVETFLQQLRDDGATNHSSEGTLYSNRVKVYSTAGKVYSSDGGTRESEAKSVVNVVCDSGMGYRSGAGKDRSGSEREGKVYSTDGGNVYSTDGGEVYSTDGGKVYSTDGGRVYSTYIGRVYSNGESEGEVYSNGGGKVYSHEGDEGYGSKGKDYASDIVYSNDGGQVCGNGRQGVQQQRWRGRGIQRVWVGARTARWRKSVRGAASRASSSGWCCSAAAGVGPP